MIKALIRFQKWTRSNEDHYIYESEGYSSIGLEHGCQFKIDWEQGQKTGFFIDQRENRALLGSYSKDKKVLNTFCYTGGFSLAALNAGATHVDSVDASARAIDLTDENVALNGFTDKHGSFAIDTFKFFEKMTPPNTISLFWTPLPSQNTKM